MGIIEPTFDANRLKGGSTGLVKSIGKNVKEIAKEREKQFKKQEKERQKIKDKRSASAKKGAATRAANRKAATTTTKGTTVPGQTGGAKGKPAKIGTQPVKASKPAAIPKAPSSTTRTPPAKGIKPVGKVAPVTKQPQRGRPR